MPKFPKCEFEGCDSHAKFGTPGQPPRRCDSHLVRGMMIFPETKCAVQVKGEHERLVTCNKQAFFGDRHKPKRCDMHKAAYTINHVANDACCTCGTVNLLTLRGTCLNPQKCYQRIMHQKLLEVQREILENEKKRMEEEEKEALKDKPLPPAKKKYTYKTRPVVLPFSPNGPVRCGPVESTQTQVESTQTQKEPVEKRSAKPRTYTKRSSYWNEIQEA
eukprot:8722978-Pyramimonas_sp.AAC.1